MSQPPEPSSGCRIDVTKKNTVGNALHFFVRRVRKEGRREGGMRKREKEREGEEVEGVRRKNWR